MKSRILLLAAAILIPTAALAQQPVPPQHQQPTVRDYEEQMCTSDGIRFVQRLAEYHKAAADSLVELDRIKAEKARDLATADGKNRQLTAELGAAKMEIKKLTEQLMAKPPACPAPTKPKP